MSSRVIKSSWYHYPNVAVSYSPGDSIVVSPGIIKKLPLAPILIGVVTVYDDETKETKSYIGCASGEDQASDELHIFECGVPFYGV